MHIFTRLLFARTISKKHLLLIFLCYGSIHTASAQCVCGVDMVQDLTVQDSCCYSLQIDGTFCPNYTYGRFSINTFTSQQNCEIYSLTGIGGTTTFIDGNDRLAYVDPGASGWPLQPGVDLIIAEICFQHGTSPLSDVLIQLEEFDDNGVDTGPFCRDMARVNSSCSYSPPIDCSCSIDITQTNPNECCYEVGIEFTGTDCANLNYQSIDLTTVSSSIATCDITELRPNPGFQASAIINNSSGTFTSPTNLGNVSGRQVLGEICLANAKIALPVITARATDSSGTQNYCQRITEQFVGCFAATSCDTASTYNNIIGDLDGNIVTNVIYAGADKMIVTGLKSNFTTNDFYGTITQIDLVTQTVDFTSQGPLGSWYSDAAYHEVTGDIYAVGTMNINTANPKSLLAVVASDGSCLDIQEYDLGDRESFDRIIYHPNAISGMGDLYISGSKENTTSGFKNFVMNLVDQNTIIWNKEITDPRAATLNLNLAPVPGGGVILMGESTNQTGLFCEFDRTGNLINDRESGNLVVNFRDAYVQPTNEKVLIGTWGDEAIIVSLDASNNHIDGKSFLDYTYFNNITFDGSTYYVSAIIGNDPFSNQEHHIIEFVPVSYTHLTLPTKA